MSFKRGSTVQQLTTVYCRVLHIRVHVALDCKQGHSLPTSELSQEVSGSEPGESLVVGMLELHRGAQPQLYLMDPGGRGWGRMGEGGGVGGWGVVGEGRGGVGGATNQCTCNCYKSMYMYIQLLLSSVITFDSSNCMYTV